LRTEIIEAQKLRIQVALAKTVFLGTLIGFFFKDGKSDSAILICPFVALMFNCMVYGLSFNIRDVAAYIGEHLEGGMGLAVPYERFRATRVATRFKDWGRIVFRVGSYGLSAAVSVFSLAETMPHESFAVQRVAWIWRIALMCALIVAWGLLAQAEFASKKSGGRAVSETERGRATKAKCAGL
jgi:hypothetical protein